MGSLLWLYSRTCPKNPILSIQAPIFLLASVVLRKPSQPSKCFIGAPGGRRDEQAMTRVGLFPRSPVQGSIRTSSSYKEFRAYRRGEGVGYCCHCLGVTGRISKLHDTSLWLARAQVGQRYLPKPLRTWYVRGSWLSVSRNCYQGSPTS